MLSYRFMRMEMNGMRHEDHRIAPQEIFDIGYTVSPKRMTMDMHMLGFMYALNDQLTVMAMANYIETSMDHQIFSQMAANMINGGNREFTTKSSGWGDTKLTALYSLHESGNRKLHMGMGLSLPTGSIDEEGMLPSMGGPSLQQMPASMQLGSGTFDLLPSLTFRQQFKDWSYGAQTSGVIHLQDENDNDYRLGNQFDLTGWAGYAANKSISVAAGLNYKWTGKLKGSQKNVNPMGPNGRSVTTAYGENYGGERIDAILGVNLLGSKGTLKGHRLSADIRLPLWQDLNGYQLETDWIFTLGWQKAW